MLATKAGVILLGVIDTQGVWPWPEGPSPRLLISSAMSINVHVMQFITCYVSGRIRACLLFSLPPVFSLSPWPLFFSPGDNGFCLWRHGQAPHRSSKPGAVQSGVKFKSLSLSLSLLVPVALLSTLTFVWEIENITWVEVPCTFPFSHAVVFCLETPDLLVRATFVLFSCFLKCKQGWWLGYIVCIWSG